MSAELLHEKLSESIIGAAMTVLNALRPGLDEKLYENALVIELTKKGHRVEQQRQFPVGVTRHPHRLGKRIGSLARLFGGIRRRDSCESGCD